MQQDKLISSHIAKLARENGLNRFITVCFKDSKYGTPLWKSDVSDVAGLFKLFAKRLSEVAFGRTRKLGRSSKTWLPVIAVPEYRKKSGEVTYLHYHVSTLFPEATAMKLEAFTHKFWKERGMRHFGCHPTVDIRVAYNTRGATNYSMKHLEFGFTLENTVTVGLR